MRGRRLLGLIAFNATMTFLLRAWLMPRLKAAVERHAQIRESLTKALGRDPTDEELIAAVRGGDRAV
jgi:hypothetical protein